MQSFFKLLNSRAAKDKCRNIRSAIRIIVQVYRIFNAHNQKGEMSTKCVNISDWDHHGQEISNPEPFPILLTHYDTSSGYEIELQYL